MKRSNLTVFAMFMAMAIIPAVFISCKKVKNISLSKTTLTLKIGETETLNLIVKPYNVEEYSNQF